MSEIVTFRGRKACRCLAEWLTAFEAELLADGEIKYSIDIYQLIGGAPKSGGTHSTGGAADLAQHSVRAARIARNMGAAAFIRLYNWDGDGGGAHMHLVLKGCDHNRPARYQITDLEGGNNGLASRGRDAGPRDGVKWPLRTWEQGLVWQAERAAKRKQSAQQKKFLNALRLAEIAVKAGDKVAARRQIRIAANTAAWLKKPFASANLWRWRKWTRPKAAMEKQQWLPRALRNMRAKHSR